MEKDNLTTDKMFETIWMMIEDRKGKWFNDVDFYEKEFTGEDIFRELSELQQEIKNLK